MLHLISRLLSFVHNIIICHLAVLLSPLVVLPLYLCALLLQLFYGPWRWQRASPTRMVGGHDCQ
jgi:hypothetical protein